MIDTTGQHPDDCMDTSVLELLIDRDLADPNGRLHVHTAVHVHTLGELTQLLEVLQETTLRVQTAAVRSLARATQDSIGTEQQELLAQLIAVLEATT